MHLADEMTPIWQLTEVELDREGIDPPYWAFAWAGGQAVARHLLDTPHEVAGRRVLDLAAGSGLCGLAAGLAGAASVTSVDIDPVAGIAIGLNAEANGLAVAVRIADLLGEDPPTDVDVIVAGDVCYDREMTAAVLGWLRVARANGVRVLLGDPRRAYLPSDGLEQLSIYDVPTTADLEGREICPSVVFALD